MLRKFFVGVLALCFATSALAADQVPLKRNNGIPAAMATGDTVGVAHGGTGASSASGTALDNISGFSGTGFLTRTGAGAYSFQSTTNGITLGNLAQIGANTVLGNATASTANATPQSMPSCSSAASALTWTTSSGFGCNTISGGSGTVTTTGSPASGNLTKFSGASSITNGDLSGDVTTSGTLATTIANSAVTLAKIQNAAANSKLLGSGASGSGSAYSEITLGTGLSMSGTTLSSTASGASITGTPTTGNCASWASSTSLQDAGAACGGSGALVLREAHTVSGASSVAFTTYYSSSYDEYVISFVGITSSGSNALRLQFSTNGGSSYDTSSSYSTSQLSWSTGGVGASGPGQATSILVFPYNGRTLTNSTTKATDGSVRLFQPASLHQNLMGDFISPDSAQTTPAQNLSMRAEYQSTTLANALQIFPNTGTFSGTIRIYAVAH